MTELVAVDIGGTHARFAIARVAARRVVELGDAQTLRTGAHRGFEAAWEAFRAAAPRPLPAAAAIAFAGPATGEELALTNNDWVVRPALLPEAIGVERLVLVNDFGAVAHAAAQLGAEHFRHVCGPAAALAPEGVTSIVGPGTGLGAALLLRHAGGYEVIETEAGHIGFAPADAFEDRLLARLRARHGRVSAERLASGRGLVRIYEALAADEGRPAGLHDETALWTAALDGADPLATGALDRFCALLGAATGDIALCHGASAVVLAGGLGLRLADHLALSNFGRRFADKGRFAARMEAMPVKLLTHPQPGLFGAAAAFARRHGA